MSVDKRVDVLIDAAIYYGENLVAKYGSKCNRYILQQREESEYSADYGESVLMWCSDK